MSVERTMEVATSSPPGSGGGYEVHNNIATCVNEEIHGSAEVWLIDQFLSLEVEHLPHAVERHAMLTKTTLPNFTAQVHYLLTHPVTACSIGSDT